MFYETILHLACKLGNIDIVKYLMSLDKFDITTKSIFFIYDFNSVFSQFIFNSVLNLLKIFKEFNNLPFLMKLCCI